VGGQLADPVQQLLTLAHALLSFPPLGCGAADSTLSLSGTGTGEGKRRRADVRFDDQSCPLALTAIRGYHAARWCIGLH
jgi:hypothetical protein